jgi:saccharopine dehydrogenase-like NADP-dependent oxidoreductase
MHKNDRRALVLGSQGGVGRAVLTLLDRTDVGRRLLGRLEMVVLADRVPAHDQVPPRGGVLLPPVTVRSGDDLARLIQEHQITEVIDLSSLDTVDCTRVCDDLGANFLCTSVEEWAGHGPLPTDEAIKRLLPPHRPSLERGSYLVGSGANPGLVNALVFEAVHAFASRVGVAPSIAALDVYAVLITEEDSTVDLDDDGSPDAFAMTWSPWHCLEELFEPASFAASNGRVRGLGHEPTACWYEARCGDRIIEGMAVPHEEIVTLAQRFPSVEIGFIYRLPPAARRALKAHPGRRVPETWATRKLYPPSASRLAGRDRVGVLLCSRRFGELWMGFDTPVDLGLTFGTNATQLQVAAGVLAGWSQLGRRRGIHFVEDLDCREFVRAASDVLGSAIVVRDPSAKPLPLIERRSRSFAATA